MKKIELFTILAFVASTFIFAGCGKDDDKTDIDEQGLTQDIRKLIPEGILQEIKDLGMPIYGGNTPPDITGTFLCSPAILEASNFNDIYYIGWRFNDIKIIYSEQNNKELTVKVEHIENVMEGNGVGGFIVGKDNRFTVFVGHDFEDDHGHKSKQAWIYSGIMSNEGIKKLYTSLVMIDDGGDPDNDLIANGQGRLIYDSDGLSERITSAKAPAASPAQDIKGTFSEKFLPSAYFKSDVLQNNK
jgi:hypothetical protein